MNNKCISLMQCSGFANTFGNSCILMSTLLGWNHDDLMFDVVVSGSFGNLLTERVEPTKGFWRYSGI